VLSVREHATKLGFANILLPIDDSAHSRQKVNHAIVLAKHFAAKIHILGLANASDDEELIKFGKKLVQIEEYLHKCDIPFTRDTKNGGNQAKVTMEYAATVNADLIVIMTDQDENITGRLMGTYAQQVVNHSSVPVLSIQPVIANVPWVHPY
jgi:nucleotide-binding universal stress UspA family protein